MKIGLITFLSIMFLVWFVSANPSLETVIVKVEVDNGHGTGFWIANNRVMTNYHVIENKNDIKVRTAENELLDVEIVFEDKTMDIAILETEYHSRHWVNISNWRSPSPGLRLQTLGHPYIFEYQYIEGMVAGEMIAIQNNFEWPLIVTDMTATQGSSGSPVLDRQGNFVGVLNSIILDPNRVTLFAFVIPAEYINFVLDRDPGRVVPGSIFGEETDQGFLVHYDGWLGVLPGSIITHINGTPVYSLEEVVSGAFKTLDMGGEIMYIHEDVTKRIVIHDN